MRILGRLQSRKQSRKLFSHLDNKCTERTILELFKSIEGLQLWSISAQLRRGYPSPSAPWQAALHTLHERPCTQFIWVRVREHDVSFKYHMPMIWWLTASFSSQRKRQRSSWISLLHFLQLSFFLHFLQSPAKVTCRTRSHCPFLPLHFSFSFWVSGIKDYNIQKQPNWDERNR